MLDGNMTITNDLILTDGIIHTRPDSLLILEDGTSSSLGNSTSYVLIMMEQTICHLENHGSQVI